MNFPGKLIGLIADEDTVVGFLLGGIGERITKKDKLPESNYLVVDQNTTIIEIEECFIGFLKRDDMDIILINQTIAEKIRHLIDAHKSVLPTILEIPSKECPYDPNKDSILSAARGLFNPADLSVEDD